MFAARSDKDSVYDTIHLCSSECGQVFLFETSLQPVHLARLNALG